MKIEVSFLTNCNRRKQNSQWSTLGASTEVHFQNTNIYLPSYLNLFLPMFASLNQLFHILCSLLIKLQIDILIQRTTTLASSKVGIRINGKEGRGEGRGRWIECAGDIYQLAERLWRGKYRDKSKLERIFCFISNKLKCAIMTNNKNSTSSSREVTVS